MSELKVSEIEIIPIKPKQGLVAFTSCVINNQFYIGNIAIYTTFNENEFRLVYPTKILPNGKVVNCIHPINKETGENMRKAISKVFRNTISRTLGMAERCNENVKKPMPTNNPV